MSREVIRVLNYTSATVTKYVLSDEKQKEFDDADFDEFMDKFFKDNNIKESNVSWMICQDNDANIVCYD